MPRERWHHYVPAFHLSQFAGPPYRQLFVYDKKWGKFGRRPAASVAVSRDYYTLPGETEALRLRVEREFARLEDRVAPLIKFLARCQPGEVSVTEDQRDALAGYAAILHVRVPAARDAAFARAKAMAQDPDSLGLADQSAFLRSARQFGLVGSDDELEGKRLRMLDDLRTRRRGIVVHRAISLMGLTTAVEKVRPLLIERQWELLRTVGWPGFVLGDQAVTLLSGDQIAPHIGFGTRGVQVMMPLSPDTLLLVSDRPREHRLEVKVDARTFGMHEPWWATANKVAWLTAKRYVFAKTLGHLQAAECLMPPGYRRRDLHDLSADEALAAIRRGRERRSARSVTQRTNKPSR